METDPTLISNLTAEALTHASGPTLEDVRRIVANAQDLTPSRRRDLCSALSVLARAAGRPLSAIPAEKRRLAEYLKRLNHKDLGVSKKRLSNLRSDVWAAVSYAEAGKALPRRPRLDPQWQALHDQLPTRRLRIGLSRMMRYHSVAGVAPESVSDETLVNYRAYLESSTYQEPRDLHRNACKLWNEAARTVTGWPQRQLAEPCYMTTPDSIAWERFPRTLSGEVEKFLKWVAGRDLLTRDPPARACAPTTIDLKRKQLQLFVSAAVHGGFPIDKLTSLSVVISEACLRAAVQHYTTKPNRPSDQYLFDLLRTVKAMARGWLDADKAQMSPIFRLMRHFSTRAPGLTPKNRTCLRQFDDGDNIKRLLTLAAELVRPERLAKFPPKRRAIEVATALAIEIEIVAPMRIANLTSLRLDLNVHRPSSRRGEPLIVLGEHEVKNRVPLEFPLPERTVRLLDLYLEQHHPVLAPSGSTYLFPTPGSSDRRNTECFAKRIQNTIRSETGLRMSCHQFRHVAAKLYLDRHPGGYEVVRRLLGHINSRTTTNFYSGLETRAAVKHYHEGILDLHDDPVGPMTPNRPAR